MSSSRFTKANENIFRMVEKSASPVRLKDIVNESNSQYGSAKYHLHKLNKTGKIKRLKRGVYSRVDYKVKPLDFPKEGRVYVNGCVYKIEKYVKGEHRLAIYNSVFAKAAKGECVQILREGNSYILKRSQDFLGKKVNSGDLLSATIGLTRNMLKDSELETLGNNSIKNVLVGIYPKEWGLKDIDIFGTESRLEGELYKSLSRFGNVLKAPKYWIVKADLIFRKNDIDVPIEMTTAFANGVWSAIKNYEVLGRLYFAFKWVTLKGSPFFIVLSKNWKRSKWLNSEISYLERFGVKIIYTDFKGKWSKDVAKTINSSFFKK